MKLQRQLSKRIGNIEYSKYVVNISPKIIKDIGWKDGEELEIIKKREVLVLRAKR